MLDRWDKRWTSCEGGYGIPCMFADTERFKRLGICEEEDLDKVKAIKEHYYQIKEAWTPWKDGEE